MTPLVRLAPAGLEGLANPLRNLLILKRLLDNIACAVFHYVDGLIDLARKSTDNEHGQPEGGSVMVAVLFSNLAQKLLAVVDVTFDRVRRTFDLQVQQDKAERVVLKGA